jgi:hypothetical protein
MSWLSHAFRSAAKHSIAGKVQDKIYKAAGIGTGNTLRRALDPGSIQMDKVKRGDAMNARLLLDPGNEVVAADPKVALQQAQINPLTGQPGTNARDLIAQQMGGAPPSTAGRPVVNPGYGNAGSPTYGLGVGPAAPRPPSGPPPNFGDINAIQQYVQGRTSAPGAAPMGAPQKRPMFGPGVIRT